MTTPEQPCHLAGMHPADCPAYVAGIADLRARVAAGFSASRGPVYVTFDGMTWPNPGDPLEVEWSLRYGTPTREQMLVAASVIAAYRQLVRDAPGCRDGKIAALRRAVAGPSMPAKALTEREP